MTETLGKKLRYYRRLAKVPICYAAKQLNINTGYFNRLERDEIKRPGYYHIKKLCECYGITIADLDKPLIEIEDKIQKVKQTTLSDNCLKLRLKNNMTISLLASKLGYSWETINTIEKNRNKRDVNYEIIKDLASFYNVSPKQLVSEEL